MGKTHKLFGCREKIVLATVGAGSGGAENGRREQTKMMEIEADRPVAFDESKYVFFTADPECSSVTCEDEDHDVVNDLWEAGKKPLRIYLGSRDETCKFSGKWDRIPAEHVTKLSAGQRALVGENYVAERYINVFFACYAYPREAVNAKKAEQSARMGAKARERLARRETRRAKVENLRVKALEEARRTGKSAFVRYLGVYAAGDAWNGAGRVVVDEYVTPGGKIVKRWTPTY